jgi:hypothetical protein
VFGEPVSRRAKGEKFFGSFFQKRTESFLLFYKKEAKNFLSLACCIRDDRAALDRTRRWWM